MKQRILLVVTSAVACVGFACTSADDPLQIVRSYNNAVILAYRTGDTGKLVDVAGERETRVVGVLIATKRSAGLALEATLERLEVLRVQRTGADSQLIETSEKWSYFDRPTKPGINPAAVIGSVMKVQYECERIANTWKVMKVKVVENAFLH